MILSLIVLIFFSVSSSAQDLIIKQPPIEPVKTSSQIVQPRVEPPPPQPIAPLAKEPMIVSVQPDQAVQPVRPPTPPPRDFIQADPAGAPPRDPSLPRAAVSRPIVKKIKEGIVSSSQAIDKFQSGNPPPPRFESPEDFKKWAASLPPEKRQLLVDRFKQMQAQKGRLIDDPALVEKTPKDSLPSPDGGPMKRPPLGKDGPLQKDVAVASDSIPPGGKGDRLGESNVIAPDKKMGEVNKGDRPLLDLVKDGRPSKGFQDMESDAVGGVENDLPKDGLGETRPRKGKLARAVIGNPDAVRRKESPGVEKQLREPDPENLKERVYERLKVPKEDRKKAIELKKEAIRLEKEGRKDEAQKKERDAKDLLPKVKIKSERTEFKPMKDIKEKRPDLVKEVKGALNPDVKVEKRALRIEYGNSSMDQTEFVYSVEPPKGGLTSFELVVEIPKDIARSVKDIDFTVQPDRVIKDDPVVKWMLKNIPQDNVAEYSFTVDGDVQNFDTLAVAAGDRPSVPQRIVNWLLDLFGLFD